MLWLAERKACKKSGNFMHALSACAAAHTAKCKRPRLHMHAPHKARPQRTSLCTTPAATSPCTLQQPCLRDALILPHCRLGHPARMLRACRQHAQQQHACMLATCRNASPTKFLAQSAQRAVAWCHGLACARCHAANTAARCARKLCCCRAAPRATRGAPSRAPPRACLMPPSPPPSPLPPLIFSPYRSSKEFPAALTFSPRPRRPRDLAASSSLHCCPAAARARPLQLRAPQEVVLTVSAS